MGRDVRGRNVRGRNAMGRGANRKYMDKKSLPVVKLIKMTSHSITMETESRRYFRF